MGLKFSALDKLISLMKSADYYLDSKINKEIANRSDSDAATLNEITELKNDINSLNEAVNSINTELQSFVKWRKD